jgi:hypothetical protein
LGAAATWAMVPGHADTTTWITSLSRSFLPPLLLAAFLSMAASPAVAPNEPLVMRIIFEDCLGYIRDRRTPFAGLATRPASKAAIEQLPARMPDRGKAVELLSTRYVASWGEDPDGRHCFVGTVFAATEAGVPVRLGMPAAGFLRPVTLRAAAVGLPDAMVADEFSPLATSLWSEPDTGHDRGPLRPVSVSILATAPIDARGIAEAGLIVMGGPPGGRRATTLNAPR